MRYLREARGWPLRASAGVGKGIPLPSYRVFYLELPLVLWRLRDPNGLGG
jgi:hypothetical protein